MTQDPTFVHLLRRRADANPAAPYLRFLHTGDADGPQALRTVGDVDLAARRIATVLRTRGATGERALMLYPPGEQFVDAFFGCLLAGAVAVPAYPPDPMRLERTLPRLRAVAEDARAKFVLAPEAICRMAEGLAAMEPALARLEWIATDTAPVGAEDAFELPDVDASALAFLQYTSGSTGTPRGVRVTHGNLIHNSAIIRDGFRHTPECVGVIWLPAYHDMGLIGGLLQPLFAEMHETVLLSPLDFMRRPVRWLEAISRFRGNTSGGPDFAYRLVTRKVTDEELARLDLSSWSLAFCGAEPVRADTMAEFAARFAPCGFDARALYPTYGLAEGTLMVAGHRGAQRPPRVLAVDADALAKGRVADAQAGAATASLVSCGVAMPGLELAVVDGDTGARVPAGAIGELWIRGGSVADGYEGDPEATAATFGARLAGDDGGPWLRTGDLCFLRDDELYVAGRAKDMLIVRGRNVWPQDLEHTAGEAHARIRPGCVAVFSVDVAGDERAVLVAEIDERQAGAELAQVARAVRAAVGEAHEVELHAVALVRRNTVPKTSSGKIRRRATRAAFLDGTLDELHRDVLAVAPPVETFVPAGEAPRDRAAAVAALQALLGAATGTPAADVDPTRSFKSFGLDSLALVALTTRIEEVFRRPLETMTLFAHPSVAALAAHLVGGATPGGDGLAAPVDAGPYVDLARACADIERRSTRYQFDLERDVAWAELDAPGDHLPARLAAELGFDVPSLRAVPEAWALVQWAMASQICATFELLEVGVVFFARQEAERLGRTRSVQLLADEEEKHIQLFRRYGRHLRARRPEAAARLDVLARETMDAIAAGLASTHDADPRLAHYAAWLRILFFEEYTVHFHQCLKEAAAAGEAIQPAWLTAHAAHRREEVQHIATDVRYLEALDLDESSRWRASAKFALAMIEGFERQFAVEGVRRLVEELHPGVRVMADVPHRGERCLAGLLARRVFAHSARAATFFREVTRLGPAEVLPAARAAATPVAAVAATVKARVAEPVAIVGMGCRLPGGVTGPDALWSLLLEGRDAIGEIPRDRWDVERFFDPDPSTPGRMYTRWGGFLDGIQDFDAAFFGIAPKEARGMDPQQRLLLECTWDALEHAAIAPSRLAGSRTGVWVGICTTDYAHRDVIDPINAYSGTGTAFSIAAGRISYLLGVHGPCVAIDTACSSSLLAVHQACRALEDGEADMAIAGGVNAILVPQSTVFFSALRAMSPTGRCHTFDAAADGYVRSEGCGVVVLKRLADAERDGDRIFAVIRGSATNQDGRSNGITAPSGTAQEAVMRAALARAGLAPDDVCYVEAHGTGTQLGDPIELGAIGAVHRARRDGRKVLVGSVKTHVGHSEGAAGVTGLIKATLVAGRGLVPANLHFKRPNPHVPWHELPVEVAATHRTLDGTRRIVGINSFGFGGSNAHVVLESPTEKAPLPASFARPVHPLVLSGHTPEALRALAARLADALDASDIDLGDVAHTLGVGRDHRAHRAAFVASDRMQARATLAAIGRGERPAGVAFSADGGVEDAPSVALLFTGQGAQYAGMAHGLYETQPVFRAAIDELATHLDPLLDLPLDRVLFDDDAPVSETAYTQPALFAVELALARLWRSFGVEPRVVVGHSIGEIAAACFAGMLSVADAAQLVGARGRLMQALPRDGAMVSVAADEARVRAALAKHGEALSVAAVNAPRQIVISGDEQAAISVAAELAAAGCETRRLDVSHAFHSAKLDPMLDGLRAVAAGLGYARPSVGVVSNLDPARPLDEIRGADYWSEHARGCVRIADGLRRVLDEGVTALVEVGPQPTLLGLAGLCGATGKATSLPSLRRGQPEWTTLADSLCRLYVAGAAIDFAAVDAGLGLRRVTLPTYPYQRVRCWLEEAPALAAGDATEHPLLGVRLDVAGRDAYETRLAPERPSWLGDHRVAGRAVVPAAAYLELVHAAAARGLGDASAVEIRDLELSRALILDEKAPTRVQVAIADDTAEVFSRDGKRWVRHARARVARAATTPAAVDAAATPAPVPVDEAAVSAALAEVGLDYGPCFRGLRALAASGDEARAEVACPDALAVEPGWGMHPALLDAALQAAGALVGTRGGELLLPVAVERYRCLVAGARAASVAVRRREPLLVDLRLVDAGGRVVAELDGLRVRAVDPALFERAGASDDGDGAFAVRFEPRAPIPGHGSLAGPWQLVGDRDLGAALASRLAAEGGVPELRDDLDASGDPRGVVLLAERGAAVEELLARALRVAQALATRARASLTLVTRGACAVADEPDVDPAHAALWGLGRSLAQEAPTIDCRLVDLDARGDAAGAADAVLHELRRLDDESQVAWRTGERRVARLVAASAGRLVPPDGAASYHLAQGERGIVDSLTLAAAPRRAPGPGEVEIAVEAAGLNFRDVLNALGRYPGPAGPLGGECAGRVTAVGAGVTSPRVGEPVMALAANAFGRFVVTDARLAAPRPRGLDAAAAATVPAAFLTAWYGLHVLGELRAGQRVLVHAAAGGVGMAAVQLAQRAGAEVFATASPGKWPVLRRLGVRHVYSSRAADGLADGIRAATGGAGVDLVLNSLTGAFIRQSFAALADGGRFLEIGKAEILDGAEVARLHPRARYHAFDLLDVPPGELRAMLDAVAAALAAGELSPLPHHDFALGDAVRAFRYMAAARHVGKVVLTTDARDLRLDGDARYLVTGGLGGLGRHVARWLVTRGARHLTLTATRPPDEARAKFLAELEARGAHVAVEVVDLADAAQADAFVARLAADPTPLRGLVHAAGVLDDATLAQQTPARFASVLGPKLGGAAALDRGTRHLPLDFFVLFSSVTGTLGAAGQANYAAANAALDALAADRRAHGLPAVSIAWGPWSGDGMAARLGARERTRLAAQGLRTLTPEQGLRALDRALVDDLPHVVVAPLDRAKLAARLGGRVPAFLSSLLAAAPAPVDAGPTLAQALAEVSPRDRLDRLVAELRARTARIMGAASPEAVDPRTPLRDLGLDSLMAVDLQNALGRAVGRALPETLLFDHPTLERVAAHLLHDVLALGPEAAPAPTPASTSHAALEAELARLEELL